MSKKGMSDEMDKLSIDLENCYGIKKLKRQFDFSEHSVYAIYAPNGSMKSSLAQTFKDVAVGVDSKDRIFPTRVSKRKITDESGADLPKENVFVVRPYDEELGTTEKTSTLLVNSTLRKEYEQLLIDIDNSKEAFLKALKKQSGSKKDLEKEISSAFTKSDGQFFVALARVKDEIASQKDAPFADVKYDTIFDERVLSFLGTKDFKSAIKKYITKYNELLEASTYFKKGMFNYFNAATIAKSLADNGFFDAKHTVSLNADKNLKITSKKQLEELIAKEKEGISEDTDLKKKFAEIEKQLNKNVSLRGFATYLGEQDWLLPKLANIEEFKEEIWKSCFKEQSALYTDLITKYQDAEKRKREIEVEAGKERTQWESVIDIFNDRFVVPFTLIPENKVDVMLGQEQMLRLGFTYKDGADTANVNRDELMEVLSTGEKKALYVLNIIFEVEARMKTRQETVFVVDDIADSFDYQNKYAIIQYLQDIAEEPYFKQIILTHNFDFFRTINSRFVSYSHCLMASKKDTGLALEEAAGIKNVFVNDWKSNFFNDPKKRVASIPFIRNLIEYFRDENDADYIKLTSLVHWKSDSASITQAVLDSIYRSLFGGNGESADTASPVIDVIRREANECLDAGDGFNFENKIVLSIAIRLGAEEFMVNRINDPTYVSAIDSNQTIKLFKKFKELFSGEVGNIRTIQQVILMTPENIHLNAFMYEPILDMSDQHLKKLYRAVLALQGSSE